MMRYILFVLAMSGLLSTSAYAHSPLKQTTPANGATVSQPPNAIEMVFGKPARLTKVILVSEDGEEQRLTITLKEFANSFSLDSNIAEKGKYEVQWRALSEDGHALKGKFNFTVE